MLDCSERRSQGDPDERDGESAALLKLFQQLSRHRGEYTEAHLVGTAGELTQRSRKDVTEHVAIKYIAGDIETQTNSREKL